MPGIQSALVIGASALLLSLLFWRVWRIFSPQASALDNAALFFALIFPAMLVLRWAKISYGNEINQDESQMLAQAMRFLTHPVPWRDVDGTTGGPLNSLLLTLPLRCGAPASWETARLVLFAANCCVVLLIYLSLRRFLTRPEVQFVLMPLVLFYAFADSMDFTHYSSEALPTVLIAACFYLLARQWTEPAISKIGLFLLGLMLGAIPFAKLQAGPLAAFLGVTALALIFDRSGTNKSSRLKNVALLAAGSIMIPIIIIGVVAAHDAFGDFLKSYILSSGKYAGAEYFLPSGQFASAPRLVKRLVYVAYILISPHNLGLLFFSGMGALAVFSGITRTKEFSLAREVKWPLAAVVAYSVVTTLCFFTAGKPFAHYGSLLIPALALMIGMVFLAGRAALGINRPTGAKAGPRWLIVFAVLAVGLQGYVGLVRIYRTVAPGAAMVAESPDWAAAARSAGKAGDTLSVWGWMPECYVRTGFAPATRDAVGHYVVSKGPYEVYYRKRHLQDLERSRPAIFIDSVCDGAFLCWNQWTAADRHESFPELAKFIDDNYSLIGNFRMGSTSNVGPMRLYALKSGAAESAVKGAGVDAAASALLTGRSEVKNEGPSAFASALVIVAAIFLCWLALWRCWRIFRPRPSIFDYAAVFFVLVFSAMLSLRWMAIVFPAERNMDESQMVAQGMRFVSHPVPWRDVDSTTSGPLNSMLLSAAFRCGAPPTWETARHVLFAANCAVILLIYYSLRLLLTRPETQFVLMPLVLFYGFTTSWDYTHYSSETLSSVLLAAGLYLLAEQWRSDAISKARMFLLGVLLGAVPFAKLQAAPLAGFVGFAALGLIFVRQRKNGKSTPGLIVETGVLIVGAVAVPALILGTVAAKGALGDFWTSYILATRKDAATEHIASSQTLQAMPSWIKRLMYIGYILLSPPNLGLFFLTGLGMLVVLWAIRRANKVSFPAEVRTPLTFIITYGCLGIGCIFTAGKPFAHYGILMLMPLAGLTGLVFFAGKNTLGLDARIPFGTRWLVAFAIVAIIPQLGLGPFRIYQRVTARDGDPNWWAPSVYKFAQPAARPSDTISIWGWMPQIYVQMGLPPATRDAVSHYAVASALQDYYRQRYLEDLKRGKPPIFIDAVGDGGFPAYSKWTNAQKHESFPELTKFIDDNYLLFTSVQLRPTIEVGPIRIYVLKERLAELHLPAAIPGAPPAADFPPDSLPGWHSKR